MEAEPLDDLARAMARPLSRRHALRIAVAGLGGMMAAGLTACGSNKTRTTYPGTPTPAPAGATPIAADGGQGLSPEECRAHGGTYQRWGLLQREFCQIPAPDADKPCTDGSQCSYGRCLSFGGNVPGQCQRYVATFGCQAMVTKGKVGNTICVD